MKDLSIYKPLNTVSAFKEFKQLYNYPQMYITSYRRVLYGESTYLGKGRSPYIADMFRYFSDKLQKPFIEVAYDLLDSEFFGRKNTLLDVIVAELNIPKHDINKVLGEKASALDNIRLCDLNEHNRAIYDNIVQEVLECE